MPYYEWRQPNDPEREAQNAFVNSYIRKHFGPSPDDWKNGITYAIAAYWRTQAMNDDYDTSSKSILDVLGSWKLDTPLQDVRELRDQYRKNSYSMT